VTMGMSVCAHSLKLYKFDLNQDSLSFRCKHRISKGKSIHFTVDFLYMKYNSCGESSLVLVRYFFFQTTFD